MSTPSAAATAASGRAARNSAVRAAGHVTGTGFLVLSVVLVARYLGVDDFGHYSFIMAVAGLLQLLADMGVRNVMIRDLAVDPSSLTSRFGVAQALLWALSAVSMLATLLVASLLSAPSEVRQAMCLGGLGVVATIQALGYSGVLRAFERMDLDIIGFVAHKVLLLLLVIALGRTSWGLRGVFVVTLVANAGLYVFYRLLVGWLHGPTHLNLDWRAAWHLLADSFPLGMAEVLRRLAWQIDRLLLTALSGPAAVGLFSGAYKFVEAARPLAQNVTLALFPLLSRQARTAPAEAFASYHRGLKVLYVLAAPGAILLGVFADLIVSSLFGASFRQAGPALTLMAPVAVLVLPATLNGFVFTALGRQRTYTLCAGLALLVNIMCDALLIPRYGFVGASVARLVSEVAFFLAATWALIRLGAGSETLGMPTRVLLASTGPTLVLLGTRSHGLAWLILGVGLAMAVYCLLLVALKVVLPAEIRLLLGLLRSLKPGGAQARGPRA